MPDQLLARIGRTPVWSGDYRSWDEAQDLCGGYDDAAILEQVLAAAHTVREGGAAFEQDGVTYAEPDHDWPFVAALMHAAASVGGALRLIDFGGALGSTYQRYHDLLAPLPELTWTVVEQPALVEVGQTNFADETLRFSDDFDSCLVSAKPNVVLLASVLSYLEDPYDLLDKIASSEVQYVLVDRTLFIDSDSDRLTVQVVPPSIYEASYPCWAFSRTKFLAHMQTDFELVMSYTSDELANFPSTFEGHLFLRRGPA